MRRLGALILSGVVVAACTGSAGTSTSASPRPSTRATSTGAASTGGLEVNIASLTQVDTNLSVMFTVRNHGKAAVRFSWSRLVAVAPDGSRHQARRDPVGPPYEQLGPGETHFDGGVFTVGGVVPGRYTFLYDDRWLQTRTV